MENMIKKLFKIFLSLSIIFFIGLLYIFFDSYYFTSSRTVDNINDPRWRVFDFNSRQAAEEDIYNVKEVPVISKVKLVAPRKLKLGFTPEIKANSWKVVDVKTGEIITQSKEPEIQFPDTILNVEVKFIPEGVKLLKDLRMYFSFFLKKVIKKTT